MTGNWFRSTTLVKNHKAINTTISIDKLYKYCYNYYCAVLNESAIFETHTHKGNKMLKTATMPEVKFSKNGYEIRTEVLDMAKGLITEEYHSKFQGWELSTKKDEKTGQVITTVGMPEFPGLDKVLEATEKMYAFVNTGSSKK